MFVKFRLWQEKRFSAFDPDGMEYNEVLGKNKNGGWPWTESERVLVPVNLKNEHWVAVALNFHEQIIHVYNSGKSPTMRGQLRPLAIMLPKLLDQLGFYDIKPPKKKLGPNGVWSVELEPTAKQDGAGDCGIYVIKFIQCLAFGEEDISSIKAEHTKKYRRELSLLLFEYGTANNRT